MVLNKHKCRYWLSVGAEPTGGVIRILNKFGFYPKAGIPWGSASVYEKPEKEYKGHGFADTYKRMKNTKYHYKQMLQEQMNIVERKRRVQAEAIAKLGEGNDNEDIELIKTDDIESEEADIFERVKKFEEL